MLSHAPNRDEAGIFRLTGESLRRWLHYPPRCSAAAPHRLCVERSLPGPFTICASLLGQLGQLPEPISSVIHFPFPLPFFPTACRLKNPKSVSLNLYFYAPLNPTWKRCGSPPVASEPIPDALACNFYPMEEWHCRNQSLQRDTPAIPSSCSEATFKQQLLESVWRLNGLLLRGEDHQPVQSAFER